MLLLRSQTCCIVAGRQDQLWSVLHARLPLLLQAWKAALKRDRQPEDKRLNVKMWRKRRSHGVHSHTICQQLSCLSVSAFCSLSTRRLCSLMCTCAVVQYGSASLCTSRGSRSSRGSRDSALISSQHFIGWDDIGVRCVPHWHLRRLMFPGH